MLLLVLGNIIYKKNVEMHVNQHIVHTARTLLAIIYKKKIAIVKLTIISSN
jgi:hypothetical protein